MSNRMSLFTDKVTYIERFENWFVHCLAETLFCFLKNKVTLQKEFNKKYEVGFFSSNNVLGDPSFLVLNSNPFLDNPGPKTPIMVEVSGIGIKDLKPLNNYWNKILSLRNKSVLDLFGSFSKTIYIPDDVEK